MTRIKQVMPNIDDKELKYITQSIQEGWLTEGPNSQEFIRHIKKFTGSKYAVLAPNGTLGLFLGLLALGLPRRNSSKFYIFCSSIFSDFCRIKASFCRCRYRDFQY